MTLASTALALLLLAAPAPAPVAGVSPRPRRAHGHLPALRRLRSPILACPSRRLRRSGSTATGSGRRGAGPGSQGSGPRRRGGLPTSGWLPDGWETTADSPSTSPSGVLRRAPRRRSTSPRSVPARRVAGHAAAPAGRVASGPPLPRSHLDPRILDLDREAIRLGVGLLVGALPRSLLDRGTLEAIREGLRVDAGAVATKLIESVPNFSCIFAHHLQSGRPSPQVRRDPQNAKYP